MMTILKHHISLVTFLRDQDLLKSQRPNKLKKFYVEEGTVEFAKNQLLILSSTAKTQTNSQVNMFLEK